MAIFGTALVFNGPFFLLFFVHLKTVLTNRAGFGSGLE